MLTLILPRHLWQVRAHLLEAFEHKLKRPPFAEAISELMLVLGTFLSSN